MKPLIAERVKWADAQGDVVWLGLQDGTIARLNKGGRTLLAVVESDYPKVFCTPTKAAIAEKGHVPALIDARGSLKLLPHRATFVIPSPATEDLLISTDGILCLVSPGQKLRRLGGYLDAGWKNGKEFYAVGRASVDLWSVGKSRALASHRIPEHWKSSVYYGSTYNAATRSVLLNFNPSARNFVGHAGIAELKSTGQWAILRKDMCHTSMKTDSRFLTWVLTFEGQVAQLGSEQRR